MGFNLGKMLGLATPTSKYRTDQAKSLTNIQGLRPAVSNIRQRGTDMVGKFLPQQLRSGQDLLDYYRRGPDAAGMSATNTQAVQGLDKGFASGLARLKTLGARSGADTTGAAANLMQNRAVAGINAQQQLAARRASEEERFRRGALATSGQLAGQGMGIEGQGIGQELGLENQIYGMSGNLAQAEEVNRAATMQRIMQFAQMAGQAAGGMPPSGGGGGGRATQAPAQDPYSFGYYDDPYGTSDQEGNYYDSSGVLTRMRMMGGG
jgi:hypothetical protein